MYFGILCSICSRKLPVLSLGSVFQIVLLYYKTIKICVTLIAAEMIVQLVTVYCDKGFRHNAGGSCDPCEVDFYKDQRGNSSCIQCPANSTTAGVASTSIDNCTIGK